VLAWKRESTVFTKEGNVVNKMKIYLNNILLTYSFNQDSKRFENLVVGQTFL